MNRKIIYLILALPLPVGIFLFLKFFGKNEFQVPPLFQEEVAVNSICEGNYVFPYTVPDSLADQLELERDQLKVVPIIFGDDSRGSEITKQIKRIEEEFSADPVAIEWMNDSDGNYVKTCLFLMPEELSVVLLDREGRIRGQYDGSSLDDMDRLIVEMKIILKKY